MGGTETKKVGEIMNWVGRESVCVGPRELRTQEEGYGIWWLSPVGSSIPPLISDNSSPSVHP